ncbi:protein-L-isoaspartate O-methyltransferase-domain-containing protein [Blastocladiella britannica]|nr:protein-L-isoaspartate O-methyltransferase-domain-containing protein [Blastocladiella britannica]
MASFASNAALIDFLASKNRFSSPVVRDALEAVDRGLFAGAHNAASAYYDQPLSIGFGATISAPHVHAGSLETLAPYLTAGAKVLDVGCGSGIFTAYLATMVGPKGTVVAIDHVQGLVDLTKANLLAWNAEALVDRVIPIVGDGRQGSAEHGPYNAIYVGAGAPTLPQALVDQLASPGRMLIPVGPIGDQKLVTVDKAADGTVTESALFAVRFIPLTDADVQVARGQRYADERAATAAAAAAAAAAEEAIKDADAASAATANAAEPDATTTA